MKKVRLILFVVFAMTTNMFAQGYKIGDKAMDFRLKSTNENFVAMKDFTAAKGFIVVFTCNHCPFAKAYEQRILLLDAKYASKGFPVIAINPNDANREPEDSFENMQELAKERKYTFPYLVDETQDIAKTYGAARTPHVFVLKKEDDGLVVKYIGAIDDNSDDATKVTKKYVEQAVDALLANKPIATAETKAIGCTIKWRP